MAHNQASTIFLIVVLLFAAANPLAHGLFNFSSRSLVVTGQLCCTADGNCPGTGVAGVVVSLSCPSLLGIPTVVGQSTTGVNGAFTITVPSLPGLTLLPITPCVVTVQLPLNGPAAKACPALSTTSGVLVSALRSVGSFLGNLFGSVVNAIIIGFARF